MEICMNRTKPHYAIATELFSDVLKFDIWKFCTIRKSMNGIKVGKG